MTDSSDRPLIAGVAGFAGNAALLFGFLAASFGCSAVVTLPTVLVLGWVVATACVRYGRESWRVAALFGSILPILFAGWVWTGRSEGQGLAWTDFAGESGFRSMDCSGSVRATMHTFRAKLVPGGKRPYSAWTFLVLPAGLAAEWGGGPIAVRGTLAGTPFRGTASRGEGKLRMALPRDLRERAGVRPGDSVEVTIELDPEPRSLDIPGELRAVFREQPEVAGLFERLAPSLRRAWATYVGEAKRPETRLRRARKAPDGIRSRAFPR